MRATPGRRHGCFRHFRRGIERQECHQFRSIRRGFPLGGGANGAVDRIFTRVRAGQCGQCQHMRRVRARHRANVRYGQGVHGQRAGFVGAQYVHRRGLIDRRQAGRKDAQGGEGSGTKRGGEGKRRGQRDRDRGEHRGQHEADNFRQTHAAKRRVCDQPHDNKSVANGEISYHAQHRRLLGADDMRGTNQFRRTAEFGARAGRCHFRRRLTTPHQRPGECLDAGPGSIGTDSPVSMD
jgi:hypothetical protein